MGLSLTVKSIRHIRNYSKFVPKHEKVSLEDLRNLKNFIEVSDKLVVLTGAGISTESGIPDYRSANVGLYERRNFKPILYQEFCKSPYLRKRYWARNFIGWPKFSQSQPNETHFWIDKLENVYNKVTSIVTQNVDNLHTKAGSKNVIELHGTAYKVVCLRCNANYHRNEVQEKIKQDNPDFIETVDMIRPDGDVEISDERIENFKVPKCDRCDGLLKPDIVFFGDSVPRKKVEFIRKKIVESNSLLVLGSTISVYSAYRVVQQALEANKKVAVVNIGPTKVDDEVYLKISARCGEILPLVC